MDRLANNLKPVVFAFLRMVLLSRFDDSRYAAAILGDWDAHQFKVNNEKLDRLVQQVVCIAADHELGGGVSGRFAEMSIRDANSPGFDIVFHWMRERRTTILEHARYIADGTRIRES